MTRVYRGLREVPEDFGPAIAAVGNFDGVHLGHQEILHAVVAEAWERGMSAAAITFDPHPERFLRPQVAPRLLTTMEHRIELLAATGVDAIVILRFDDRLARLSAREFVDWVLTDALNVAGMHEGGNFHFGYRAAAGVRELTELGVEYGFGVTAHQAVKVHRLEVSSSTVRRLVAEGDVKRARWMLGRAFEVRSTPKRDRGIGSKLLVPTVNLAAYDGLLPAFGIYVTRLTVGDRCFQAVTSLGNRPTFEDAGFSVETHILDFEPVDMNEETPLKLEFLMRLRPEAKFDSIDALREQIFNDIARAKKFFARASGSSRREAPSTSGA
ncbi:MAG TPA: bifunctional riboflavin kinase/FAD synthetase [Terracidiphilus sp.]|nr:bifunctional riboflavin kinase/FAD synthetase [Terracidiphilus sp.]